jgi:hypothetical protein
MKNRILLALALTGIGIAVVLWAIAGRATRTDPSRATASDPGAASASSLSAPALDADRAPSATQDRAPFAASADPPPEPARAVTIGTPFRGRVVDVRTGEPVPAAIAKAEGLEGTIEAPTDAEGRFAGDAPLRSDFEEIAFFDAFGPAHIRTAPRDELESLGEDAGWLARIRIGPTYRLRMLGPGASDAERWKLQVVESPPRKPERAWGWIDVIPGDPSWARYDNPGPEPEESSRLRIEVQNEAGTLRGSAPIAATVGIHPGVLEIAIDASFARVLGRVLDSDGRPMARAQVYAISRAGPPPAGVLWPTIQTDAQGRYAIGGLAPGPHWIHARPRRGEEAQTIEIALAVGETTAPDIVVPAEKKAGAIEGFLRSAASSDFPVAVVRLRAADGRSFDHFDIVDTRQQLPAESGFPARVDLNGYALERKGFFEFQQVPEGEYLLTVISSDGRAWRPSPLRVRPPNQALEIFRADEPAEWQAGFHVVDARTGERLERFRVQFQMPDLWSNEDFEAGPEVPNATFAEGARFRWNVYADGYGLASGTESVFAGPGGVRVANVQLRPGFAARLLFRDAQGQFATIGDDHNGRVAVLERPPVAGVRVYADGEPIAVSDADGAAVLELAAPPDRIDLTASGWTVLGSERFRDGRILGDTREVVVWLTR